MRYINRLVRCGHLKNRMEQIVNTNLIKLDSPRAWRTYTGGQRLDLLHGNEKGRVTQFPEEWILSVVAARNAGRSEYPEEGMSHLSDYDGMTLKALIDSNPAYYLGKRHAEKYGAQTGVLVKLIDAAERLTVQVHPDKEKAQQLFQSSYGKTECWHILDDAPINGVKPCIYMGFKPGITREKWKKLFERQDIPGMLGAMHRIEVKKGDTILIQGGVPHAIGEGCFLMEIQEPTDFTIRIERITPAGLVIDEKMCHQGLGFERMFDCFSYEAVTEQEAKDRWFIKPVVLSEQPGGRITTLIGYEETPLFRLDSFEVWGKITVDCIPVFSGIYILEGEGTVTIGEDRQSIKKGEQFFIPAGVENCSLSAKEGKTLKIMRFMGPEISF